MSRDSLTKTLSRPVTLAVDLAHLSTVLLSAVMQAAVIVEPSALQWC